MTLIEQGAYAKVAALSVGVTEHTYYNWLQWGRTGKNATGEPADEIYKEFFQSIKRAEAAAELDAMMRVRNASGEKDAPPWAAQMTFLERRFRERWSRGQRLELQVQQGVERLLDAVQGHMTGESYAELLRAIATIQELEEAEDSNGGDV